MRNRNTAPKKSSEPWMPPATGKPKSSPSRAIQESAAPRYHQKYWSRIAAVYLPLCARFDLGEGNNPLNSTPFTSPRTRSTTPVKDSPRSVCVSCLTSPASFQRCLETCRLNGRNRRRHVAVDRHHRHPVQHDEDGSVNARCRHADKPCKGR